MQSERRRTLAGIVLFVALVLGAAFSAPMLGGSPAAPGPGFVPGTDRLSARREGRVPRLA